MRIKVDTNGHYDFVDITEKVAEMVKRSEVEEGVVYIFIPGSTAAITAMEHESGVIEDMIRVFEQWAPEKAEYKHHERWGDWNGAAHIKSAIIGPSLSVPIEAGRLQLGTWQQIVLIDFDERPRTREIIVKIIEG